MIYYEAYKAKEDAIKSEIQDFLCAEEAKGRRLNKDNIETKIIRDKMPKIDFSTIKGWSQMDRVFDYFYNPVSHTSSVEICYNIRVPRVLEMWGKFLQGTTKMPQSIKIKARSEVLAGTGS